MRVIDHADRSISHPPHSNSSMNVKAITFNFAYPPIYSAQSRLSPRWFIPHRSMQQANISISKESGNSLWPIPPVYFQPSVLSHSVMILNPVIALFAPLEMIPFNYFVQCNCWFGQRRRAVAFLMIPSLQSRAFRRLLWHFRTSTSQIDSKSKHIPSINTKWFR